MLARLLDHAASIGDPCRLAAPQYLFPGTPGTGVACDARSGGRGTIQSMQTLDRTPVVELHSAGQQNPICEHHRFFWKPKMAGDAEKRQEQVRSGVDDLFRQYSERLARLARKHLDRRLAARLDPEDVVQSVFRTLFRRATDGGITIDSSTDIWQLLVTMTVRKASANARYNAAGRRAVEAELPLGEWLTEAVSGEPDPADAAVLVDEIAWLVRDLPEVHARVLEMRLAGHAADEIAREQGVSRRTVYRVLELLQQRIRSRTAKRSTGEGL